MFTPVAHPIFPLGFPSAGCQLQPAPPVQSVCCSRPDEELRFGSLAGSLYACRGWSSSRATSVEAASQVTLGWTSRACAWWGTYCREESTGREFGERGPGGDAGCDCFNELMVWIQNVTGAGVGSFKDCVRRWCMIARSVQLHRRT
jgi:hypothetical protein